MKTKVLIVEDQFVEANDIQLMLRKAGYEACGIARSVEAAEEIIKKEKPTLVLLDIFLKGKRTGIDLARQLNEDNIAFIYLSANSNEDVLAAAKTTEPYGFIVKPFREKDLLVTLEIAQYRHQHSREARQRREAHVARQLEESATGDIPFTERMLTVAKIIQQEIPFDYLAIEPFAGKDAEIRTVSFLRIGFNEYQIIGRKELAMIAGISMDQLVGMIGVEVTDKVCALFNNEAFEKVTLRSPLSKLIRERFSLKGLIRFVVPLANGEQFTLGFYSRRQDGYTSEHLALLYYLQPLLAKIMSVDMIAEISTPVKNPALRTGTVTVKTEFPKTASSGFEGIIGNSHLLLGVFDQISQVAPFDTSVLILGESGTGKEKIARCIHYRSPRKGKPMVKVNCAALPPSLIESELFGHEKGSFTGAVEKRIGKFAQADGGTIFLDEIGEMPIDLQVKLLRVLQEKEIEPVGGKSSVKVDVRVIAATNRNLEREVAQGRFRLDLYYRLNVFPVVLPSLRERMEDISLLADHFIENCNQKLGKNVTGISEKAVKSMMAYNWPGNIRELEHLIERSVLLSKGTIINDIALPMAGDSIFSEDLYTKTIHENERDHIISVLKKCKGKIWGSGGAAELLNVPPTTLKSKMEKLGINKDF